jgi:hypothetical protein
VEVDHNASNLEEHVFIFRVGPEDEINFSQHNSNIAHCKKKSKAIPAAGHGGL